MKHLSPLTQKRFVAALAPRLRSLQFFFADFSDKHVEVVEGGWLNSPLAPWESMTRQFLGPVRTATTSIRAFYRNPPSRRNRVFKALVSKDKSGWTMDPSNKDLFDARFVFLGMRDSGLRLVYSFDSKKVDLGALFSALWNPHGLANPGTAVGPVIVRYAKSIPPESSTLRFVLNIGSSRPCVLVYAPRRRISSVFALAVKHANFIPPLIRSLDHSYGQKQVAAAT